MPTKMMDCRRNRVVIVSVYVEKPRRRRPSSLNGCGDRCGRHHHQHHHYVHHSIKQEVTLRKPAGAGKGYDRRAELLLYSRHLRESPTSSGLDVDVVAETSPLEPKSTSSTNQQPPENIVAVQSKLKHTRTVSSPACLYFLPRFITKSLTSQRANKPKKKKKQNGTTNTTMKSVMTSIQMPKKKSGFISKLLYLLQKKR